MYICNTEHSRKHANDAHTITLHVDWSENARLRQSAEKRRDYYHEDQISTLAMYLWAREKELSIASLSEDTDHSAGAVWA